MEHSDVDENELNCGPPFSCPQCSRTLYMPLLYPRHGSLRHICIGVGPKPTPLFKIERIELKPYDMPVGKIFEMDSYGVPELPLPPKTRIE
jgi:hypothetical protein